MQVEDASAATKEPPKRCQLQPPARAASPEGKSGLPRGACAGGSSRGCEGGERDSRVSRKRHASAGCRASRRSGCSHFRWGSSPHPGQPRRCCYSCSLDRDTRAWVSTAVRGERAPLGATFCDLAVSSTSSAWRGEEDEGAKASSGVSEAREGWALRVPAENKPGDGLLRGACPGRARGRKPGALSFVGGALELTGRRFPDLRPA